MGSAGDVGAEFETTFCGESRMRKLVLVRHGQSTWNRENRFTGWTDVGLSEKGMEEAAEAGQWLRKEGYRFDLAYTSVLSAPLRPSGLLKKRWTSCGFRCKRAGG